MDKANQGNEPAPQYNQKKQRILLDISRSIISTLNYQEVLQIISDGMSELLEIETAAIYLLEKNEKLYLGATTPPLGPNFPDTLRIALVEDHPHILKTITTRAPQYIGDMKIESLSPAEKAVTELRNLRSLLYFPFIQKHNVLGVLILGTSNKTRIFSKEEIDLGQTVANQLSIGIQNAQLHHDLQIKNEKLEEEIHQRKKIEEALINSKTHLSNALRIARLGHWEYDVDKDEFTFTDEFFEIYGTNADHFGGYKVSPQDYVKHFLHPEDHHIVREEIKQAIENPAERKTIEHKILFADGGEGNVMVRYRIIKDKAGKAMKLFGVNQDITERKKAEDELIRAKMKIEESEYLYRHLFDQAAEGIILMTFNGELIQVNEAFAEMHGYEVDAIMQLNIRDLDLLNANTFLARQNEIKRLRSGEIVRLEVQHRHKDGHVFPLYVITKIIHLKNSEYLLCFHQDLTEQKRIEKELKIHRDNLETLVKLKTKALDKAIDELKVTNIELSSKNDIIETQNNELKSALFDLQETQSMLVQSEKMASLGVLTAGIAHEINNPLNFIMGAYEGLKQNHSAEENNIRQDHIPGLLEAIKTGIERAQSIVMSLNQFSRDRVGYTEDCYIHKIIDNCLTIIHHQFKERVEVIKNYHDLDAPIKGNIGNLHQVFLNVLTNSIQAIEGKGQIDISISKNKDTLVTKIKDTGIGIPKENLSKITDPFFTTKEPGEGRGLGLSICYKIIKEQKGTLKFSSTINEGTTATIILPIG